MTVCIGVRREDKSEWERRVPLTPQDAAGLQREQGIHVQVQPSAIRAFSDAEYAREGVSVQEDLSACSVVFGIKEMPEKFFEPGKAYVFFAHVIKGQPYNMPMLRRLLDKGCTLVDYERVADDTGRRLVFFGWHAGVAGAVDTLWALGRRLEWEGIPNPFSDLSLTHTYYDLAEAKGALGRVGSRIRAEGLPPQLVPLIIGVAGYGNVSRGVQEMLDLLPIVEIEPGDLSGLAAGESVSRNQIYKVVFKEWHMVEPISADGVFELQDYYRHPQSYRGVFRRYLPHLTALVNAIFWTSAYPRLVTKQDLKDLFASGEAPRLRVIGDISCDIDGAIECTVKSTEPGHPVFVYDPIDQTVTDGYEGRGIVDMAVDILPSELPREASVDFGRILAPFVPALARCDYARPFEECGLAPEIKRAVIAYRGQLTPDYAYLRQYLDR